MTPSSETNSVTVILADMKISWSGSRPG